VPSKSGTRPEVANHDCRAANKPSMNSWKRTMPHTSLANVVGHASPVLSYGFTNTERRGFGKFHDWRKAIAKKRTIYELVLVYHICREKVRMSALALSTS
jgi:hypothetical protein